MQSVVKATVYAFLGIFVITALLTLGGLGHLWFGGSSAVGLPYLGWLVSVLLLEVIGVIVLIAKRGLLYFPDVRRNYTPAQTSSFMKQFISHGSSVTIVSNRLGWLADDKDTQAEIIRRAQAATKFEIITSQPASPSVRESLEKVGVRFYVTGPQDTPEARFTLINADRSGAERLAIARGTHPHHEITIFDSTSGPQIIGLAKDIVRKSKAIVNAAQLG